MNPRRLFLIIVLLTNAILYAHGPIHDKINDVNRRISKDPNNPFLYIERSSYYKIDRNFDGAQADLIFAQLLDSSIKTIPFLLAELNFEFGYYQTTINYLYHFEKEHLVLGETYLLMAKTFDRLFMQDSAMLYVNKAFPLQDQYNTAFFLFASQMALNQDKSNYSEAQAWLLKGKSYLPYDLVLQEELVVLALKFKKYDEAESYCTEQIPKLKRKEYWQFLLASVYLESNEAVKAKSSLQDAERSIASLPKHHRNTDYIKNLTKKINDLKVLIN